MFDKLSDRLGGVFDRLRGRGALNEADVREAMREVRVALLEADVALPVVRAFIDKVTEQAVGAQVLKSVTPGQQVVKIVNDALVEMLGAEQSDLNLAVAPPAIIMMVGLQGSGKTTTTAKIAKMLKTKLPAGQYAKSVSGYLAIPRMWYLFAPVMMFALLKKASLHVSGNTMLKSFGQERRSGIV